MCVEFRNGCRGCGGSGASHSSPGEPPAQQSPDTPVSGHSRTSDDGDTLNKGHNRKKPLCKGHTEVQNLLY